MPRVNEVHVDKALSNLAIGYHPTGMVAEQVMPVINVQKESDKYYEWNKYEPFRSESTLRADGAESKEVNYSVSTNSYSCEEYALKTKVTDRQMANADDVLKLKMSKTRRLQEGLRLDMEKRVATLLTTLTNWASTNRVTLSGTDQWNDDSYDSDAVDGSIEYRIDTGKEAIRQNSGGNEPNKIIIPSAVAKVIKRDATIRELIKYTHDNLLVDGDLPPTLWGMQVVIPKSVYVSTKEGASTQTFTDVWGKNVVMLYVAPNAVIDEPSAGYIFRNKNFQVSTWREEKIKSDYIEDSVTQTEKLTSNVCGYLIKDCIA